VEKKEFNLCKFPYPLTDEELKTLWQCATENLDEHITILKTISDPTRLQILKLLSVRELCVCVLVGIIGLQYFALSYHLKALKDAKLITSTNKRGFQIYTLTQKGKDILRRVDELI